ncbi:MAG: phospho-N-acetylmuramoyl-pentapeptide-transferase [Synergistaceae bacterium]|jgi:phospho-N-acetylmuramoyl-pentapeptide-transferase|nr:phospho-N-acetylmuramoyl-pentapeptide-transferase [Synergistaceae bacterium]
MIIKTLCLSLIFFAIALYCQGLLIRIMRRLNVGEAIKSYGPESHLKKRGTPGMGGIVALILVPFMVLAAYLCGVADAQTMFYIWSYPMLAAAVGLIDDVLKYRSGSSEGLRSLQKLFLQIAISVPWAYYISRGGIYLTPDIMLQPHYGIPLLAFLGVGIQNAVNVTDGLDGLAGGAVAISLISVLLWAQSASLVVSAALALAVVTAFLWHNSNPAQLFMGDVGSHLWAGIILSLCVAGKSLIFVIPAGFLFGIELTAVAIQIIAIRGFKRKVFRMSPLHHHFELAGWKEPSIVVRFWLVHIAGMAISTIFILTALRGGLSSVCL